MLLLVPLCRGWGAVRLKTGFVVQSEKVPFKYCTAHTHTHTHTHSDAKVSGIRVEMKF